MQPPVEVAYPDMRIIVSGSSGLIGTTLVASLESAGHEVTRLRRGLKTASEDEALWDPQTSGGLLIALPPDRADELVATLEKNGGIPAALIGTVTADGKGRIRIVASTS